MLDHVRAVGRQAIALAISFNEGPNLFNKPLDEGHWFRLIRDYLRRHKNQISSDYFSFITFNYDIALEHYLHTSLTAASSDVILARVLRDDFLSSTNFNHLHGKVAYLPWTKPHPDIQARKYGTPIPVQELRLVSKDLLLPHEALDTGSLRQLLVGADVVVILGFWFSSLQFEASLFQ